MDIRQLAAFVAVFEERNITAAAQRLFVSQPTLSVTIRQLEEALGATLFVRQARGVEVSEAARALYPRARALLADAEGLRGMFRHAETRRPLHLGVEGDISSAQIERFVAMAYAGVPNLLLHLQEGCVGDARLAVEEFCCEDELFLPVWDDPYVLALPADVRETSDKGWITCPAHPSHQRLMSAYGNERVVAQADSLKLALHLVRAGIGAALLPASLLDGVAGVRQGKLQVPLPVRRIGLCYAAQSLEKPAVRELYDYLRATPAA
ncbi:LysR family transcriptional regulator [Pseudomonas sp. QL9]|uniref:LysR family transcriptional regulator n=1 Tax=Pseudomonas sp. QL9 TaxID=3242725 RepID=UPI003529E808